MTEFRRDPVAGFWSIIAAERGKRPLDFRIPVYQEKKGECPFCYGNERLTPPEVLAYGPAERERDSEGWFVRVVPNKFPALLPGGEYGMESVGPYRRAPGLGAHEVVVEAPAHDSSLGRHSLEQAVLVLRALRERHVALGKEPHVRYVHIFKNSGAVAGASLEHTHFQILAMPFVPPTVGVELEGARSHHARTGRCVFCEIAEHERQSGERWIESFGRFAAFCPYASRLPYEIVVMPLEHRDDFGATSDEELPELAALLRTTVRRLEVASADPPYNLLVHTTPTQARELDYYHWHIEIMPRLAGVAGFELGTGCFINPTAPEMAAEVLRTTILPPGVP